MNGQEDVNMKKKYEPVPLITISDLEALKVAADPLRNQIMELIVPAPITVSAIADKLGLTPNKLYYHISLLEKHGFIQVVETEVRGNLIEKTYWLTAYDFDIAEDLMNFGTPEGQEHVTNMFLSAVDATRADMRRSLEARAFHLGQGTEPNPRQVVLSRSTVRIPDERAVEFVKRFKKLIQEFSAADELKSDEQIWALSVFMYPSFYYEGTDIETDGNPAEEQGADKK